MNFSIRTVAVMLLLACGTEVRRAAAQIMEPCDPTKTVSSEACAKCHAPELEVWKNTPHFRTFDQLHRTPQAKEIAKRMGISSIKRSEVCNQCHYTMQDQGGTLKPVAGVSCESCHGAAKDWLTLHNDFGGASATRATESAEHREQRLRGSIANGMRNPNNPYLIARSCLNCHTVPNEKLVNVGGHAAGSPQFDFVAWSQGRVKHTFLGNNGRNVPNTVVRLRVMYLVGLVAELEFSTRAVAKATSQAKFGLVSAQRAAAVSIKLYEIQRELNHPLLEEILRAFAAVELRTNNVEQLNTVADTIRRAGEQLGAQLDGSTLSLLDSRLPPPGTYK